MTENHSDDRLIHCDREPGEKKKLSSIVNILYFMYEKKLQKPNRKTNASSLLCLMDCIVVTEKCMYCVFVTL